MRLKLFLESQEYLVIPWDYRTVLTRSIYEVLRFGDVNYANWLHQEGFRWGARIYRLFVYSELIPVHYELSPKGLENVRWMNWQISSPDKRFIDTLLSGLEKRSWRLELFGVTVEVVDLVRMETPELHSELVFHTISPIAVSTSEPSRKHPVYLRPEQPEFVEALQHNLVNKWQAFHGREWHGGEFSIRVWNPRQKMIRVFDTDVRAWYLNLQMWGDEELICFAYDVGIGIKNSQGFGMIEPGG